MSAIPIPPLDRALAEDLPDAFLAVALLTIAVGLVTFAATTGWRRRLEVIWAGVFAAFYAVRLYLDSAWGLRLTNDERTLTLTLSALEYLVPIPGTLMLRETFGRRWRRLNTVPTLLFPLLALIAIPLEVALDRPHMLHAVVNALVGLLVVIGILNLTFPSPELKGDRILRAGVLVFILFVANEHLELVRTRWDIISEPLGFAVLIASFVYVGMRRAAHDEAQLAAVRAELTTARSIQQSLIPQTLPQRERLLLAAAYRPASDVGGDFYEVVEHSDGSVGVLVADVSGHGVPAALLASMLKVAVRSQEEVWNQPATLLSNINRQFCGAIGRQFITAVYVSIDAAVSQAKIAAAGHPPPLLRRGDALGEVETEGPILGRFRDSVFAEASVPLASGDAIILYTDGLTEACHPDGTHFGEDRLHHAILASRSSETLPDELLGSASVWTGGRSFDDDVTIVVIQRR